MMRGCGLDSSGSGYDPMKTVVKCWVSLKTQKIYMLAGELLTLEEELFTTELIMTMVITITRTLEISALLTVSKAAINLWHHPVDHLNHHYYECILYMLDRSGFLIKLLC